MLLLPDLASFPDYSNEHRSDLTDSPDQEIYRLNALIAGNFSDFIAGLDLSTAPWKKQLEYYFNFQRNYQAPDFSVGELNKGVVGFKEDVSFLNKLLAEKINELLAIPDWTPPPGQFDRGRQLPELVPIINQLFTDLNILEFSSAYIRKQLQVANVVLHVSKETDSHWRQFFYDAKTTPKFTNAHIDPKQNVVKAMIYLNNVTRENGAFSYAVSSNKNPLNPLQNVFGRAISTSSYCHNPESRKSVFKLPANLRVSHNFGRCVFPGSALWNYLERKLRSIQSDDANIIVFDPGGGIHQGGICVSGTRLALQILMK